MKTNNHFFGCEVIQNEIYLHRHTNVYMYACMYEFLRQKMKPTNPYRVKKNIIQERTLL